MNTAIVVILVLAFVVFFVVPVATASLNAANKAPLRARGPAPLKEMFANPSDAGSIKTGLINVGDVGMPPGHIAPYYNGVIVSTTFLGPNVAAIAAASPNGKYVLTVTDETGQSASVKVSNMGSGGFYYVIYNDDPAGGFVASRDSPSGSVAPRGDNTGATITKKFAKSKQLAISVAVPSTAVSSSSVGTQYKEYLNQDSGGGDFACYFDGRSAESCKAACDANPKCKSYNNIHRGGRQEGCCYKFISSPISPFPGGGVDLYVKQDKPVVPPRLLSFEQKEYNPLSQAIDQTIANFSTEPTGIEADPSLSEIEYVQQYDAAANVANQQIQYALAGPNMPNVNESLPPANTLARKAKKCETGLVGRNSCAALTKPEFADCGVCIQGGTSMDGANPGKFIGGLLSLKSGRTGNSVSGPNLGKCPPGMFFVDAQACQTAASQLNCAEAAPQAGRTAEGQKIPLSMCSASSAPSPTAVGTAMENGDVNSLALAQKIVAAAKASGNYDAWLQMLTTYYNNAIADGSKYINMLNNSPFGTQLAQSGILTISGNPTASPYFGAYQKAQQGYMAATTG